MKRFVGSGNRKTLRSVVAGLLMFVLLPSNAALAQNSGSASTVPTLVSFTGMVTDVNGRPLSGIHGVTFFLYKESASGAPLWMETQNVQADSRGHYSVMLGSTTTQGLPKDLFASGEARWLAVQIEGQAEQARVLLLSVPYALKAADAETIGGLPASAFVLAGPSSTSPAVPSVIAVSANVSAPTPPPAGGVTGSGTANFIPLWTSVSTIGNSSLFESGTGASAKLGVNTKTPAATLDVKGSSMIRGVLTLPSISTATAAAGSNSQALDWTASAFNGSSATAVNENFLWQAEPSGNNTNAPSASLNLLFGSGTAAPSETGLKLSSKGLFTFAAGQTFPGTGTVTSVGLTAPSTDFTVSGSPVTGTGTLKFAWSVAPTNADTANAIVKRDATGSFNATSINGTGTFSATTANVNAITGSTSLDGGSAIVGSSTTTGGSNRSYGVVGNSISTVAGSTGVLGQDGNTNAAETNEFTMGVQGASSNQVSGMGVFGFDGAGLSSTFNFMRGFNVVGGVGVWGDGGPGAIFPNVGVVGSVDDGIAGYFANNSPSDYDALVAFTYGGTGDPFLAGNFNSDASCSVDRFGNLNCTGSKNAVVPIDGGKRIVAMSAIEAPQNWFEDAGEAQLVNGVAAIQLDSSYTQTVNTDAKYEVFLTPYGDCKGLYVSNRTENSFEVHELGRGAATLNFGYRIMALRKNYENVRFADHTHDLDAHKRMLERMKARASHAQPYSPATKSELTSSAPRGPGLESAH